MIKGKKDRESKKKVYVVSTYYHAMIACVKQLNFRKTADIIITSYIPDGEILAEKIKKSALFDNTIFIGEVKQYEAKNRLDYYFNLHRKNSSLIEAQIPISFYDYDEINIFHDDIWVSHYLKDKKIKYCLVEDALDSFKSISQYAFAYMLPGDGFKERIKRLFRIGYTYCGADRYTISVEVNDKADLEIEKAASKKVIEIPRKLLFDSLTVEDIEKLKNIFAQEIPRIDAYNYCLLLTRALYADGVVKSEEEQIRLHRRIAEENMHAGENLILKPHPRDLTDYTKVFPDAIILNKNMPAEIMQYLGLNRFKKIIAFDTTRIRGVMAEEYIYKQI